ncbi:MAG: hypothetical protein KJO25_08645, partial [Bacteroidia bacterium]|nr:hypothetical protein [Bacteroidia bacterium]
MIKRSQIAAVLAILFMAFVSAPLIVQVCDQEYDITVFIDASEEEEKKGNESVKDLEFEIAEMNFRAGLEASDRNLLMLHH